MVTIPYQSIIASFSGEFPKRIRTLPYQAVFDPGLQTTFGQAPRFMSSIDRPELTQGFALNTSGTLPPVTIGGAFSGLKPRTEIAAILSTLGSANNLLPFPGGGQAPPAFRGNTYNTDFYVENVGISGAALDRLNISRANTGSTPLAFTNTLDLTLLGYNSSNDLLGGGTKQPGGIAQIPSGILVAQTVDTPILPTTVDPDLGIVLTPFGYDVCKVWDNQRDTVCQFGSGNSPLITAVSFQGNYLLYEVNPLAFPIPGYAAAPSRFVLLTTNLAGDENVRSFPALDDPYYDAYLQSPAVFPRLCSAGYCFPVIAKSGLNGILVLQANCGGYYVLTFEPDDDVVFAYTQVSYYQNVNDGCIFVDNQNEIWMTNFSDTVSPFTQTAPFGTVFSSAVQAGITYGPAFSVNCRPQLPVASGVR